MPTTKIPTTAAWCRDPRFVTYENTKENALRVGWVLTPEYCLGDQMAPRVTHDHIRGLFIFHD